MSNHYQHGEKHSPRFVIYSPSRGVYIGKFGFHIWSAAGYPVSDLYAMTFQSEESCRFYVDWDWYGGTFPPDWKAVEVIPDHSLDTDPTASIKAITTAGLPGWNPNEGL